MAIDLWKEMVVSARDVPNHLPTRNGKKLSRFAIYRYMVVGLRGLKLEFLQLPAGKFTSLEAIQRFADRLTALGQPHHPHLGRDHRQGGRNHRIVEQQIDRVRATIRKKGGR